MSSTAASPRTRAIRTLHLVLHELKSLWLPVAKDWRLNKALWRLTGLNKQEMIDKVGAKQVEIWRRSFDIHRRHSTPTAAAGRSPLPGIAVPEPSLKDRSAGVLPYYDAEIAPAHGAASR
jgi:2,3-bisphosphoglycerate-dependent phosphoglycerate mutase